MIRRKFLLAVSFIIVSLTILGATTIPTGEIDKNSDRVIGGADEIELDLLNDTITSQNGVNVKYGNLKLKVFNLKRDKEANRAYVYGDVITQVDEATGTLKLESTKGDVSLDGNQGTFYDNFGYLEIGKVTGGEAPNDKIYFGGDVFEYRDGKLYINDGWITTDFHVDETGDPKKAGYHFLSENIIVEPDKQLTLKGSDFYLKDNDVFPFALPWYRVNIRQGSEVPLFPEWGTKDYYGWQVSWGALYGDKDSKWRGGFSPKFADQMGLLIGRWENWYETENFGTAKLNIDDALVWSKVDKNDDDTNSVDYEEQHKRYRLNYTHEYSGEKGKLYFSAINGTYNMIPKLDDIITDYEGNSFFYNNNVKRPKLDSTIGFYSMDADLKELGVGKDITLKTKLKLTDDKEAYAWMVYDDIDDIDYGSNIDNDLYSQVSLYKDNAKYKIGGYYNYLYDMDPGSTLKDNQSRAEDFGFEFFEKEHNIGFSYDEKNGDRFRKLGLWERDPNLDSMMKFTTLLGEDINYKYNPSMIREYSQYDSKDLRISFGDYELYGDYNVKAGLNVNEFTRELDLAEDPLRRGVITGNNKRDKEYNRYENTIYHDFREVRGYVDFYSDTTKFTFASGETKEEFWDREGIYNQSEFSEGSYRKYVNESKFYEVSGEQNEISLNSFGELALFGGVRYDKYDKGYNPYGKNYSTGEDSTLRTQLKLNHVVEVFDNMEDRDRKIDFAMSNDLKLFYQRYDYDSGDINFGDTTDKDKNKKVSPEEIRLKNKDNIYEVKDTVTTTVGNTETVYNVEYKRAENPANTSDLNGQLFKNDLTFNIDDKQSLTLNYGQDRKYTSENERDRNYNDLTFEDYGAVYNFGDHKFTYQVQGIDSKIRDNKYVDDADEEIKANTYGYDYTFGDNKLGLSFSQGTDERDNNSTGEKELDVDNKIYRVSFLDGGDVENFYAVTYEDYKHKEQGAKTNLIDGKKRNLNNSDVLSFTYEYRDKRFTDEELKRYAELEFNKDSDTLTQAELYRVRDILRDRERNSVNFNLNSIMYDRFNTLGDYKRNFKIYLMAQRNETRYDKTGDLLDSLEEVNARFFYSQNRMGVGYEIDDNAGWVNNKWDKIDREHKVSLMAKVGKPSEGWNVSTYAKFYENYRDKSENNKRKSSLDGLGIEIGREFGYYEWAVAYEREYDLGTRDYEWRVALQFTLLAFPDKPIFGLGADTDGEKKTSPQTYLFEGLTPQDIVD